MKVIMWVIMFVILLVIMCALMCSARSEAGRNGSRQRGRGAGPARSVIGNFGNDVTTLGFSPGGNGGARSTRCRGAHRGPEPTDQVQPTLRHAFDQCRPPDA